ncbi:AAA family ATPase [bacterium]|nr:AAA family ATPase [bacterium]
MNNPPTLYIGIAAPLVEAARVWLAEIPPHQNGKERREKLKQFPHAKIGAYDFSFPDSSVIAFRTSLRVNEERVQAEVGQWSGKPPQLILNQTVETVPSLDSRKVLDELKQTLSNHPLRIVSRIGLTLQQLQRDLMTLQPELVILDCHGTKEGCLLLEDRRARADVVPGERLFSIFQPRPKMLFLAACYSEAVLHRAKESADWQDAAILHVSSETPVEVAACVAFQSMFIPAFLQGKTAGDAFDAAKLYVENDPLLGSLSDAPGEVASAEKFQIREAGKSVCLESVSSAMAVSPQEAEPTRQKGRIRRSSERFVGRQREMAKIIDGLLPRPAGIVVQEKRLVTLTKEGGIGKTAIALEVSDWTCEREFFPGGVFEVSCERFLNAQELLTHLLALFGVPLEEQRGDLFDLLANAIPKETSNQQTLLLLDNMDDLLGQHAPREVQKETERILETMLTIAPNLRILATCRWQLGLADHELELGIPPMVEEEARDVFVSHLDSHVHRLEVKETWKQPDSAIRQLVQMSGHHPQSLRLLARQMGRPGMTLDKLRNEAHTDLMKVLADPLATKDEDDRLKKVEVSYELSYRHLSEDGQRLFEWLARLPSGVWCGELAEQAIQWHELLGDNWRETMEKELDYFALVHFEPENLNGGGGTFEMLTPMREFALKKYQASDHAQWEAKWIEFWGQRVEAWNQFISGRLPEQIELPEDERRMMGAYQRKLATVLFERTQPNWLALLEHALRNDASLTKWILLEIISFCQLSGQNVLLKSLSELVVNILRMSNQEENLAPCLGTLGNVQRALGESEAARESFKEALNLYLPYVSRWAAAFEQNFRIFLRNYTNITPEDSNDQWWQLWKRLNSTSSEE